MWGGVGVWLQSPGGPRRVRGPCQSGLSEKGGVWLWDTWVANKWERQRGHSPTLR